MMFCVLQLSGLTDSIHWDRHRRTELDFGRLRKQAKFFVRASSELVLLLVWRGVVVHSYGFYTGSVEQRAPQADWEPVLP
jgi:hypothetical protein